MVSVSPRTGYALDIGSGCRGDDASGVGRGQDDDSDNLGPHSLDAELADAKSALSDSAEAGRRRGKVA